MQALQYNITVPDDAGGQRLDRWLADTLPDTSRAQVQKLLKAGNVHRGEETVADGNHRVKPGMSFAVTIPAPPVETPSPADIDLDIVCEDAHLLVVNKPAGMVVHPGAGQETDTLVNALLHHLGPDFNPGKDPERPGIVHRLDKDTSGLLTVAKTETAHAHLSRQFRDHSATRIYTALVRHVPAPTRGTIEKPIARHPHHRRKMAVCPKNGRDAVTHYRTERAYPGAALLSCQLETGRTHQIRVHLADMGHPVLGDPLYGRAPSRKSGALPAEIRQALSSFGRQALHARRLTIMHPEKKETCTFEAKLPPDFSRLIDLLENI